MSRSGKINKADTTRSEPLGSFVSHAGVPFVIGEETRRAGHRGAAVWACKPKHPLEPCPLGQRAQPCPRTGRYARLHA